MAATIGTKGGEFIKAIEDTSTVSPSILKILANKICSTSEPKMVKAIYQSMCRLPIRSRSWMFTMVAMERQNT